eukprot:GHVR01143968.1.p1 GENE.GHVR01143968.1~~GHVR01143968.1.p1  ORF type:complete len:488 (+),score=77.76 GHVR01143968.1:81-1544(+)
MPARTVFIQARNIHGTRITKSMGRDAFNVRVVVHPIDGSKPRQLKSTLHDRGDGTYGFLFYYSIVAVKYTIDIRLKDGGHVDNSPYTVMHPNSEMCYCPLYDYKMFLKEYTCHDRYPQIEQDFSQFDRISESQVLNLVDNLSSLSQDNCLVHYTILNNKIYGRAYGKYQGFRAFLDDILLSLSRKVILPDVEFVFNLGDYPLGTHDNGVYGEPVVSWSGSVNSTDIILPTYRLTRAQIWGVNEENPTITDLENYTSCGEWSVRVPTVLFKGRDSNQARLEFVMDNNGTSRSTDKEWVSVGITRNEMDYIPDEAARLKHINCPVKKINRIKFIHFFKHKYQLNIDGTVAAYRFPALISGGSLVFKQESPYYEHMYVHLVPWKHYIPVSRDLKDTRLLWEWATKHDDMARKIARNANLFSRKWLRMEDIYCYHYLFLFNYKNKMVFNAKIREGMTEASDDKLNTSYNTINNNCVCAGEPLRSARSNDEL